MEIVYPDPKIDYAISYLSTLDCRWKNAHQVEMIIEVGVLLER